MANIIGGKTSVIYSDENSYLRGKVLPGSKRANASSKSGSRNISQ